MSRDCSGEATPVREGFPAIVVVDHQLLVLSLLNEVLLSKFEDFEILALSEPDELERIAERDLRLVLLRAPEGCEAEQLNYCNHIAEALEGVPVLLLCDRSDERLAAAALARGYRGLVSNCTPVGILLAAIQLVLAGGAYFPMTNSGSRGEAAGHEEARPQASLEAG
ncbi:MAG TPA: hypothetical protein VLQ65_00460, partial [Saliniramus sp.]|nr:hypothetical protein [Saliniramus sp.]